MNASSEQPTCSEEGCDSKPASLGLCAKHYKAHQRKRGIQRISTRTCDTDGRDRPHSAKGLCKRHYKDSRPRAPYQYDPRRKKGCLFDGCDGRHFLLGVCARHFRGGRVDGWKPSYNPADHNLFYKYRIRGWERDALFIAQDGLCAICRDGEAAHIDHHHAHACSDDPKRGCRDCVRGGLCSRCNITLAAYEHGAWGCGAAKELLDNPWWRARANLLPPGPPVRRYSRH